MRMLATVAALALSVTAANADTFVERFGVWEQVDGGSRHIAEAVVPYTDGVAVAVPRVEADCPRVTAEADAECHEDREAASIGLVGTPWPPGSEQMETTASK